MGDSRTLVAFRIKPEGLALIDERAAKLGVNKRSEMIRRLLREALAVQPAVSEPDDHAESNP